MSRPSRTSRTGRLASWPVATVLLTLATAIIFARWHASVHHPAELVLLVVLSVFAYAAGDLSLPAFQIDVGLVLALAAIILTGPVGALVVLAVPELLRAYVQRHRVRRIAAAANLASFACMVLVGQAVLLALPAAHAGVLGRLLIYMPVATGMVLANFLVTRGIVAGLVDGNLAFGRRNELRALGACLALAPFAAVTACLLPVFGILSLVAVAVGEAFLGVLVRVVTWTPSAGGLTVPEARARYVAAIASRMTLSRSQRRVLLAAARTGTGRTGLVPTRLGDHDRIAKTLIIAGLWSGGDDCFSRLQPAEMGIESRILLVAHGWAELTASGTERLEHRLALLTLHNNPRRYDRRIVAVARDLIPEPARETKAARIPCTHALPRRLAQMKLAA
jgi:hypothetical protein